MSSTLEAFLFLGIELSGQFTSIKNTGKDFTFKQMFDIFEKSDNQMRSTDCMRIIGMIFSWKDLSLIDDEEVISPSHAEIDVFSDFVLCLER